MMRCPSELALAEMLLEDTPPAMARHLAECPRCALRADALVRDLTVVKSALAMAPRTRVARRPPSVWAGGLWAAGVATAALAAWLALGVREAPPLALEAADRDAYLRLVSGAMFAGEASSVSVWTVHTAPASASDCELGLVVRCGNGFVTPLLGGEEDSGG
jgi:hypothetical protein